jgi:acyl-coenzyme A thioesterase PaaI-like protein
MDQEKCLPQHAVTVEMNVKYHSSQKTTDLFIAENVSKSINHKNVVAVDLDLAVDRVMVEDQATEVRVMVEDQATEVPGLVETIDQEKCLPQHAVTVEMNVKYHSSQKTTDLFIAENVSKITDKASKLF